VNEGPDEVVRVERLDMRITVGDCERLEPLVFISMLEIASAAVVVVQAFLEDNEVEGSMYDFFHHYAILLYVNFAHQEEC
jgi:hypothetical protein